MFVKIASKKLHILARVRRLGEGLGTGKHELVLFESQL